MGNHHKLNSSSIKSIDHFDDTLEIHFANGSIYHYKDCPKDHHTGLKEAESPGKYFRTHILYQYEYERKWK